MVLRRWLRQSGRYHAVFVLVALLQIPWECCT